MPLKYVGEDRFHLGEICDRINALKAFGPDEECALFRNVLAALYDGIAAAWEKYVLARLGAKFESIEWTQEQFCQRLAAEYGMEESFDARNIGKYLRGDSALTLRRCGRLAYILGLSKVRDPASNAIQEVAADRLKVVRPMAIPKIVRNLLPKLKHRIDTLEDLGARQLFETLTLLRKREAFNECEHLLGNLDGLSLNGETRTVVQNEIENIENICDTIIGSVLRVDRTTVTRWMHQDLPISLNDSVKLLRILNPLTIGDLSGFEWAAVATESEPAFCDDANARGFCAAISYVVQQFSRRVHPTNLGTIAALREFGRQKAAGRTKPISAHGEKVLEIPLYPEHRLAHWLVALVIDATPQPLSWLNDGDSLDLEDDIGTPGAL